MVSLNKPTLLLDSDVLINWLCLEEDILTHAKLWEAPHKIISLIEKGSAHGFSTLLNIMEIRFVLRRKKKFEENKIQTALVNLVKFVNVTVPDEINLLKADELQVNNFSLSVIDAALLAVALASDDIILISRDENLLKIAARLIPSATPETFLKNLS